jgi:hypothetical protein
MKKILLLVAFMLVGCSSSSSTPSEEFDVLKVLDDYNYTLITPTGAPAIPFIEYGKSANYETNTNVSNVGTSMLNGSKDIVVVDLVSGAKLLKNNVDYKLKSILTFGNFYIFSTGNDSNDTIENSDYIVGFGNNNTTPAIIFHDIFPEIEFDAFVPGVSDIAPLAISGKYDGQNVDYLLIAEPVLSTVLANANAATHEKGSIKVNLQTEWKIKHNNASIYGAAIFIKNGLDKKFLGELVIDLFLQHLSQYIDLIVTNPDKVLESFNEYGDDNAQSLKFGVKGSLAKLTLQNNNGINLGYYDVGNKDEFLNNINTYLGLVNGELLTLDNIA